MKIYLASFKAKETKKIYKQIRLRLLSFHEVNNDSFGAKKNYFKT